MNMETFESLTTSEIAQLVKPKVCVFPINGTRRWFFLEHSEEAKENFVENYLDICGRRHLELYKLFFDHGISTLLTPVFGPELLERGAEYMQVAAKGLLWFAQNRDFVDFYHTYDVRVRVYGDTERYFADTPYNYVLEAFNELAASTASHQAFRLFFGVCGHDPTENVAQIAVCHYQQRGTVPNRRQIVEAYYGEYVEPVDLFIGFDRPAAFDMPLLATGEEDLYFTVAPSPFLNAVTLRSILYDHLFARRVKDADYEELSTEDWKALEDFYRLNQAHVLGVGKRHASDGFWYPLPQVKLPPCLQMEQAT